MLFNLFMDKPKKRIADLDSSPSFAGRDQLAASSWQVDIEGSGQRKRYLRSLKSEKAV